MKLKMVVSALVAFAAAVTFGEVFEGLEYFTTGEVEPGVWNTQYDKCVEKALKENIPMVVFWGRKGCGQCKKLDRANGEDKVIAWRKERGYIFLYGIEGEGDSSKVLKLAQKGGSLPFVGFYWGDQNGDGVLDKKDVLWCGCGRSGKMPAKDGTLADQFMNSAEKYFHDYQGNTSYAGGHFVVSGSAYDRLEYDGSASTTYVKLARDPNGKAGSTVLALYGADGKECATNVINWAEGQTETEVVVDLSKVPVTKAAGDEIFATLYLVDEKGEKRGTNRIYRVASENTCGNPDFAGCANFGVWTMDLAAATNMVATNAEENAYTLVSLQGSLWCPDCANTERNFLDATNAVGTKLFAQWALDKHVALVSVDIPNYSSTHLGLVDESGKKINDPYMSYESYDDVDSPCLLSTRGYSTRLARPEEYPASGADASLTNYFVRSGSPYLSRKGVSEAEARAVWERNWNLAWKNYEEGGFHSPADGNKNRTGVPIFVLLRKDGTVAARFTDLASVSPMKYDKSGAPIDNYAKYIGFFDQMLEIAKTEGDHADATEILNDYPCDSTMVAPTNGVAVSGELSHVDQVDAIRLGWFNGNGKVKVEVTGLPTNGLSLVCARRDADGNVTIGADVIKALTVTNDLQGVGDWFVLVKHNALTNFTSYTFAATVLSLEPGSSRTEYAAPEGEASVKVRLVEGEAYRIEGMGDNASLFEQVEGNAGFYTVKAGKTGEQAVALAEVGGTLVIQKWQPGEIGFATGETIVHEADCPTSGLECVIKVSRYEGLSGWVKVGIEVDPTATSLSPFRYELLTTNLVWNDDGIAEKEVRLVIYPDNLFDGFDRNIVLRLTGLESEDGPTKATVGTAEHLVYIENDDEWVICQNMRVDAAYEIPLSENVTFKLKKADGALPTGIKIAVDNEASPKVLAVSGSTKKLGKFEAVYEVTAKLADGTEWKKEFKIKGIVINPAVDGIGPDDPPYNDSCVNARTYPNVMLTGSNTAFVAELPDGFGRLCGVLKLTIAKGAAKMSAKYTCAEGSISFSSATGVFADAETHAFTATMKSSSKKFAGYELKVDALPDGSVDLSLTDGEATYSGSVSGAPWSKSQPASRWQGYYTVAFRPIGTVSNGVTAAGAPSVGRPYLTLKMESPSQVNKGSMKWAGLLPNGKSVSGSSVLVAGDIVAGEPMAYLPTFKRSGSEVFAGLMRIVADAKDCKSEGSVFLPDPFGYDIYTSWTHLEKKSDEFGFERIYRPYGGIYDHTADDLQCCCIEKYGLQATNMAFNVTVSSDFPDSAKYGPLMRKGGRQPVVGPFNVWVESDSIELTDSDLVSECDAKLKFNRKTGIVSGTFLVPFEAQQVKATYKGVILLGFGDACGCSFDPENVMPFVNGSWYISDKLTDSDGKTISYKRGGAITIDAK